MGESKLLINGGDNCTSRIPYLCYELLVEATCRRIAGAVYGRLISIDSFDSTVGPILHCSIITTRPVYECNRNSRQEREPADAWMVNSSFHYKCHPPTGTSRIPDNFATTVKSLNLNDRQTQAVNMR
jgi:hypothetical protein